MFFKMNAHFAILMISAVIASGAAAETYTEDDLRAKSIYDLEKIKRKELTKPQKLLVKNLLKDKNKIIEDCTKKRDYFVDTPLVEIERLDPKKMSKSEKKMYGFILKGRQKVRKQISEMNLALSVKQDEFEGTTNFSTGWVTNSSFSKSACPFTSWYWMGGGLDRSQRWYGRGASKNESLSYLQIYFRYTSKAAAKDSSFYYGIYKAVGKGVGQLDLTMIDFDYYISDGPTEYYHDMAFNFSQEQLHSLYEARADLPIRIYSKAGNLDVNLPYYLIEAFYEGIEEKKLLAKMN